MTKRPIAIIVLCFSLLSTSLSVQKLMAVALACGLTLTSTNLFAQSPDFVPVGPPVPVGSQQYSLPYAAVPLVSPQSPKDSFVHDHSFVTVGDGIESVLPCFRSRQASV